MITLRKPLGLAVLVVLAISFAGCADRKKSGAQQVKFQKIAGYTDQRGQGKIRVYTFSGEPENGAMSMPMIFSISGSA